MGSLIHGIFITCFCFIFRKKMSQMSSGASWSLKTSLAAKNRCRYTNFQQKLTHHDNFMTKSKKLFLLIFGSDFFYMGFLLHVFYIILDRKSHWGEGMGGKPYVQVARRCRVFSFKQMQTKYIDRFGQFDFLDVHKNPIKLLF